MLVAYYYADFLIDERVIIELKAVTRLLLVHEAQVVHYLAATGIKLAILINFGDSSLKYKRIVRTNISDADKIA